jgi:prepilin-type N-terminal cleavage/methylation domain-containing protein
MIIKDVIKQADGSGMTLIEVVVAMALAVLLCAGLYKVGVKTYAYGEDSRSSTEARYYGKQRLEEIIATGRANLTGSPTILQATTNTGIQGYPVITIPRVVWHTGDKAVTGSSNAVYGEVHVDVAYWSPLFSTTMTDTFSTIIQ